MPGVCLNSWQTFGCESTIGLLWRRTDLWERLALIVLALMAARIVVVLTGVSYRCYLAERVPGIDATIGAFQRCRRELVADLSHQVGTLKSIASTAPYLGLAGTCLGITSAFRGYSGTRQFVAAMMVSGVAAALISTATGLLVAVPAIVSHNYLWTRIHSLESEIFGEARERAGRSFHIAQKLPLTARFSNIPFAVIAAPALAIFLAAFMSFPSSHSANGLPVGLTKIGALKAGRPSVEPIIIEITATSASDPPAIYVHSKKTSPAELENSLRKELRVRPQWLAYVQAENDVSWGEIVGVIDVVEGVHANVILSTVVPNANVARKSE